METIDFSGIEKTKFELSTRVIKPLLIYLEKKYNKETTDNFISETGMDRAYLDNENNWISYEYYLLFLEKVAQFTGNEKSVYDAGVYILSKESYGSLYSLLVVLKLFGSPKIAYKKMCEMSATYSNVGKLEFKSVRKHKIIIKSTYHKGYKQTKLNCLSIQGGYAAVPLFWNLPPARVKEIECATEGHESCIYEISWLPRTIRSSVLTVSAVAFLAVELLLFFFKSNFFLDLKDIIISAFIFLLLILRDRIAGYKKLLEENRIFNEERSQALADALENSKKEYQQLKEANLRIFEVVNKLTIINFIAEEIFKINNENDLIKRVLNIIAGCLNFDRGYCFFLNDQFECTKPGLILDIMKNRDVKEITTPLLQEKTAVIANIFEKQIPRKVAITLLDDKAVYSILMPFSLRDNYYLFVFDNYKSKRMIKESKLYFFSTIANQIRLALDNIYTARAAHYIISSIPSAILIFERDTLKISYVNKAYLDNYKIENCDVIGKSIMELLNISGANRAIFKEKINGVSESHYIDYQELPINNKIIGYTLFGMLSDIKGRGEIGMVMKDITKQKELQDQLLRSEKLAALGTLASGVAHEINNPLYGVLGTAEVIADETDSVELKKMAEDIIDFTMQVSDIVKDLSAYSRSIRDEKPKFVNINDVISETLRIIRYSPFFIDVKMHKSFGVIPGFFALSGEISQIFMNLISNAVQAMNGKGELSIVTELAGDFIRVVIEDNGPGIHPEIISKIFDPFFTTKPAGEGTGLGLNIVYRLVTRYNGFIRVENSETGGARFILEFPVQEQA